MFVSITNKHDLQKPIPSEAAPISEPEVLLVKVIHIENLSDSWKSEAFVLLDNGWVLNYNTDYGWYFPVGETLELHYEREKQILAFHDPDGFLLKFYRSGDSNFWFCP